MLIQCPECGHQISDKAEICVSCGFGIKQYLEDIRHEQELIKEKEEQKLIDLQDFEKIKQQIILPQRPWKANIPDNIYNNRNFGIMLIFMGVLFLLSLIWINFLRYMSSSNVNGGIGYDLLFAIVSLTGFVGGIKYLKKGQQEIKKYTNKVEEQFKKDLQEYEHCIKNQQQYIEKQARERLKYRHYEIPYKCPSCRQVDIFKWKINEESGTCECQECRYKHVYNKTQNIQFKQRVANEYNKIISSSARCSKCGSTAGFIPIRKKWDVVTGYRTNKIEMVCKNCGAVKR